VWPPVTRRGLCGIARFVLTLLYGAPGVCSKVSHFQLTGCPLEFESRSRSGVVGQTIGFRRLLGWAAGPQNFMKNCRGWRRRASCDQTGNEPRPSVPTELNPCRFGKNALGCVHFAPPAGKSSLPQQAQVFTFAAVFLCISASLRQRLVLFGSGSAGLGSGLRRHFMTSRLGAFSTLSAPGSRSGSGAVGQMIDFRRLSATGRLLGREVG
jgi:hypothetical protein